MHAGEASNGSDQRAHGDIFYVSNGETSTPAGIRYENARRQDEERQRPAGTRRHILRPNSETSTPAGNRDEKCTPARRATARASGHTVAYSTPQAAKRPCRRGNGMKNARR
ncbi:MAG: hypothetical protein ACLTDS_01455 [Bianqueaceae bacterium]